VNSDINSNIGLEWKERTSGVLDKQLALGFSNLRSEWQGYNKDIIPEADWEEAYGSIGQAISLE